jgi:pyrroline-5-carboxylate reductase
MTTLAIIGVGKMGEAILSGVLRSGWPAADVLAIESRSDRADELAAQYGVTAASDIAAAVHCDAVLIVVKPADAAAVVAVVAAALPDGDSDGDGDGNRSPAARPLIISAAAGVPCSVYESRLPAGHPVVRVMPNTPAMVGEGMSAISAGAGAGPQHVALARVIFEAVGQVVEVPEAQLDAVTALSGSGPAYLFLLAEAMVDAGADLGLDRAIAATLIAQTVIGAGVMLRDSGDDAVTLRKAVTSPNGTTAAALDSFESAGLRSILAAGARAARDRSVAMGAETAR